MAQRTETTTELARTDESSGEIQAASLSAAATRQVEVMVTLAKRFPRNEDAAWQRLSRALRRPSLAEKAEFSLPRGKKQVDGKWVPNTVSGPSVHLAREMLKCWGNMMAGYSVVADDAESVTIRGVCWELETNAYLFQDAVVPKLVQKRIYGEDGKYQRTAWTTANADEIREKTANIGARLERNCILHSIARDRVDDAVELARKTLTQGVKADPDKARKGIIVGFGELGISVEQLEEYLGHRLAEASPEELADLIGIGKAIRARERRWSDYAERPPAANGVLRPSDLAPSEDPNRGHDQAMPPNQAMPPKADAPALTEEESEAMLRKLGMGSEASPEGQKGLGWK